MDQQQGITITRRDMLARLGMAAAAVTAGLAVRRASAEEPVSKKRPNIIFILIDDLRWDALSCMGHPFIKTPNIDRLRNEGVMFNNAFVTTSLCAPSRASFLTGAYAHNHGVVGNWGCEFDHDQTPSFPRLLRESGYSTAFVGKWHMGRNAEPRPGFDYWLSFFGQGTYTDPELNENGRAFKASGYTTDLLTDSAIDFINKQTDKPYCLCLSHKAVHSPFTPAERHKDQYAGVEFPKTPGMDDTFAGKPAWTRGGVADPRTQTEPGLIPPALPPGNWDPSGERRMGYVRTLSAVDDCVGRILKTLETRGELDNTLIIFTSDNGYFFGEHGRGDKRLAYEESIRIPMIMRYPALVKPGSSVEQMVLNLDVAPTLLEVAGVKPAATIQGQSVVPLLTGSIVDWRKSFLYEYWIDLTDRIPRMVGVRTEDWKLVRYPDIKDIDEMYDLKKDRYELTNLAENPAFAEKHKELGAELDRLMQETGYGSKPIPQRRIRSGGRPNQKEPEKPQ